MNQSRRGRCDRSGSGRASAPPSFVQPAVQCLRWSGHKFTRGSLICLTMALGFGILWAWSYGQPLTLFGTWLGREPNATLSAGWLHVWIPANPNSVDAGGGWRLPGISWSHLKIVRGLAYAYGVLSLHLAYPTGLFAAAGALLLWRSRGRYQGGPGFPVEVKTHASGQSQREARLAEGLE